MSVVTNKTATKYYFIIFIFYLFFLEIILPIPLSYFDEIIALTSLFFLKEIFNNTKQSEKIRIILLCITLSITFALLGNYIYNKQKYYAAVLLDLVTFYKFFMILAVGYAIIDKKVIFIYRNRIIYHCKLLLFICLSIVALAKLDIIKFDFSNILNLYNPIALYSFSIFCFLSILENKNYNKYIFFPLILGVFSGTSVATAYSILLGITFWLFIWKDKKIKIKYIFIAIPLVVWMAYDDIYLYFLSPDAHTARLLLLTNSFKVACDYFPVGSGFATYATSASAKWYSILYYEYGLNNLHGLVKGKAKFVSDTFYPALIGETGYIGTLFYITALVIIGTQLFKIQCNKYRFTALFIFLIPLANSIANSAFFHSQAALPAILIGGMLNDSIVESYNKKINNNKNNN